MNATSAYQHSFYLLRGAKILATPGYRRFILIPVISNIVLFVITISVLISFLGTAMEDYLQWASGWFSFLEIVIWILFGLFSLVIYSFTFTSITNLFAAPFNGFLAEKIQAEFTNTHCPPESLARLIARTLFRELQKVWYFVVTALGIWLLTLFISFIPLVQLMVPFIGIAWACWVLAIQYIDYAADNNQISFRELRTECRKDLYRSLLFGGTVFVAMLIPVLNVFVMSAAVAGGTLYWIERQD